MRLTKDELYEKREQAKEKKRLEKEEAMKNAIVIRAKTRQELREQSKKEVPPALFCESSYTNHHMYAVFPLEQGKFVAICTRCLKQTLVSV